MADIELQSVLKTDKGAEFIAFCLERIDKGQLVQTIWHDWQKRNGGAA